MKRFAPAVRFSFAAMGLALATACTHNGSPSVDSRPALISAVDTDASAQEASAEATLVKHKIKFNADYETFDSDIKEPLEPCDKELLTDLNSSAAAYTDLQNKQQAKSDAELFRDDALNFSRKVTAANASLAQIVKRLGAYCEAEAQQQAACLDPKTKILIRINDHTTNTPILHPYLQLGSENPLQLFRVYRLTDPFVTSTSANGDFHSQVATRTTSDALDQTKTCLSAYTTTDLGQDVALTSQTLFYGYGHPIVSALRGAGSEIALGQLIVQKMPIAGSIPMRSHRRQLRMPHDVVEGELKTAAHSRIRATGLNLRPRE